MSPTSTHRGRRRSALNQQRKEIQEEPHLYKNIKSYTQELILPTINSSQKLEKNRVSLLSSIPSGSGSQISQNGILSGKGKKSLSGGLRKYHHHHYLSYKTFLVILALVSIISMTQHPVMAATVLPPKTANPTREYKGPLPYLPDKATPELLQKGNFRLERVAQDQNPKWNTDCLLKQEELHEGKRTILDGTGTINNNNQPDHMKRLRQFGKRDKIDRDRNNKRMRAERRAVNSTNMLCNGRNDLCDLRYNQVTYPGTHNSATYQLQYDCNITTQTCLETKTVCTAQAQNCTLGWETRCTKMSNTCLDKMPSWLHWLCGAFTSVCESTEQVCLGWEQICTSSLEVCNLWGSACLEVIPDWALECLWENQPDHTISQQLNDGIRFLDLGTCLTNNNTQIVMCHGFGAQRAIGVTLDSVLTQVQQFMQANPQEVLTIEFNEFDGDSTPMAKFIVDKVVQYFAPPSGHSILWPRKSLSDPWPTLREMILADQRIVIFMSGTYWGIPDPKPAWANQKDTWKLDGFSYTSQDTTPAQLNTSYYQFCDQGPPKDGSYVLWQQMDINMAILEEDIVSSLKKGQIPQICIGPLAIETNSAFLEALSSYCYSKWPYWFRVRVNDYWQGSLFSVVNHFNDLNVARVKSGDSITPY